MWPFRDKQTLSPGIPSEIQDRLHSLEHELKLIRIEWEEVYDKITHAFDRERKRRKRVLDDVTVGETDGGAQGTVGLSGINWEDPVVIMAEARKRGL